MDWKENEHPRDNDGKFTDKNGTPAEHKRLKELGIESDDADFLSSEKLKYSDIKSVKKLFDLQPNDFAEKLDNENQWLGAVGTEPEILKDVLKELGLLNKPEIISKNEYDALKRAGAKVLYRGVKDVPSADKDLRDSDLYFVGRGALLHGLYFSDDEETATSYSNEKGSVAEAILSPKAKIISIYDLESIDNENRMEFITGNISNEYSMFSRENVDKYFNAKIGRTRRALEAISLGYDAVDMGHSNVVVLNRSKLIMRGD